MCAVSSEHEDLADVLISDVDAVEASAASNKKIWNGSVVQSGIVLRRVANKLPEHAQLRPPIGILDDRD